MWLVQCQSTEQHILWAWDILTKIPCLARWDDDKVRWLRHYCRCAGFLFVSLFRLTFVTLLKISSLLVPVSAILLVSAGLCQTKKTMGGNVVSSGWRGWDGGQSTGLKHLRCRVVKSACVLQCSGGIAGDTERWLLILSVWRIRTAFQLGLLLHPQQRCLGHGSGGLAHQPPWGVAGRSDPFLWLEQRELLDICKHERRFCCLSGSFSTLNWLAKVRLNFLCWLTKPLWTGSKPNPWTVSISEFQFVAALTLTCR